MLPGLPRLLVLLPLLLLLLQGGVHVHAEGGCVHGELIGLQRGRCILVPRHGACRQGRGGSCDRGCCGSSHQLHTQRNTEMAKQL